MGNPARLYAKQMYKNRRYHANWLPGVPRKVGDYGILEDGYFFTRLGNIADDRIGIEFDVRPDDTADDTKSRSKKGVSFSVEVEGTVDPVKTKVTLEFKKVGLYDYQAKQVTYPGIADLTGVGEQVLDLLKKGVWRPEWTLISQVAVAKSATILISKSRSGKIELTADGDVGGDIADASLDFKVSFERDMFEDIVAAEGLNPVFKLYGVGRYSRFGSIDLGSASDDANRKPHEFYFDEYVPFQLLLEDDED